MIHRLGAHWFYVGDARDYARSLPDGCMDLALQDPPYGTASPSKMQTHGGKTVESFDLSWDKEAPTWWPSEVARLLKPGGGCVSFCDAKDPRAVWDQMAAAGINPLQVIAWEKTNPPCNPRKNYQSAVELAVFGRKPGKVGCWNGGGATRNVWRRPEPRHYNKATRAWWKGPLVGGHARTGHPTQKPLGLIAWLLETHSQPGDAVLDLFAGSGTTLVGCEFLGRRCCTAELAPEYIPIVLQRWANREEERVRFWKKYSARKK